MSWEQLKNILDENRRIIEEEKTKPIIDCPQCAYTLLNKNSKGLKACPMCGWRE